MVRRPNSSSRRPIWCPTVRLILALRGAAARGVKVSLILPEKVNSFLTRYASRSYYDELLDIGVDIFLYRDGLLHTKSITADRSISMFGTVNLDMRSLWLNYEVALFVYDVEFGTALHGLQESYMARSDLLDPAAWAACAHSASSSSTIRCGWQVRSCERLARARLDQVGVNQSHRGDAARNIQADLTLERQWLENERPPGATDKDIGTAAYANRGIGGKAGIGSSQGALRNAVLCSEDAAHTMTPLAVAPKAMPTSTTLPSVAIGPSRSHP